MHIPLCCKVTDESQVTFAVEAVAASQARDLAQEVCRWQGRVFLPLLHAVGLGSFAGELPPDKAQRPGVLVMELADSTLEKKKFEGDALIMVAWALASTLALLNEAGFSERNDDTPHPLPPPYDHLLCVQKSSAPDRSILIFISSLRDHLCTSFPGILLGLLPVLPFLLLPNLVSFINQNERRPRMST